MVRRTGVRIARCGVRIEGLAQADDFHVPNEWREEQEWPLARAVDTEFFLRVDGWLTDHPPQQGEDGENVARSG